MPSRTRRGTAARAVTATVVAVGVLAAVGGVAAYASTRQDAPTYRTATVTTQTVQQVLQATGTIEPGTAATVTFPVSGTVASVRVAMGDPVRAGQVLATLDTTALRSALASARAGVANAALALHQAETGQSSTSGGSSGFSGSSGSSGSSRSTATVATAQHRLLGSVHQVDLALAGAKSDLATATASCGTPSPSPAPSPSPTPPPTCAQAQQRVLADEAHIFQLQQGISGQEAALDKLLAATSRQSASTSTNASRSGSAGGSATASVSAAQLAADQAALDAADAELAVARQNLARAVIVSPFDGVVSAVGLTAGQPATAGSASSAVDVIDPVSHTVSIAVDVAKVPLVKVGQPATVVPDGSGKPLAATVSFVAPAPSTSGGASYLVRLAFGGTPAGLRDGVQAAVTLVVAQADDALSVPTSAVSHLGALTYVTVLDAGTPRRSVVTVGAVGPLYTQITRGLTAGQQVVLADLDAAIPSSTLNNRFARFAGAGGLGGLAGTGGFAPGAGPNRG